MVKLHVTQGYKMKIFSISSLAVLLIITKVNAQCTGISLVDTIRACPGAIVNISASLSVPSGYKVVDTGWWPTTGISDTNSLSPTLIVGGSPTLYKLHTITLKNTNLVVNGDFSAGATGFSTSYVPGTGGPWGLISYPATYAIATNPSTVHMYGASFGDHTSGSGKMMVINGSSTPDNVWCETIPVLPNTYYMFSAWFANWSADDVGSGTPEIQFKVNSVLLGSSHLITAAMGKWVNLSATWYSGSSTSADICIYDKVTAFLGNDFALDDISFNEYCTTIDSVYVSVNTLNILAGPDTSICNGSVNLYASGASKYTWSPATGLSCTVCSNPIATVTSNTAYVVVGVDTISGCIGTDTVTINYGTLTIDAGKDQHICENATAQIVAKGGSTYMWSPSNSLSCDICPSPIATPSHTTMYTVIGADTSGCTGVDSILVEVSPLPVIKIERDSNVLCKDHVIQVIATGGNTYIWSPGQYCNNSLIANPVIKMQDIAVTYRLKGTDNRGCTNYDSITIPPFKDAVFGFPTAFSPNGDGVNDILYIRGANLTAAEFFVYNRWGQLVFETNDISQGWDGTYNGIKQPIETYVGVVRVTTMDGCKIVKKGSVTLLR